MKEWEYYRSIKPDIFHFNSPEVSVSEFRNHLIEYGISEPDLESYRVKNICPLTCNCIDKKYRSKLWEYVIKLFLDVDHNDYSHTIDISEVNLEYKKKLFGINDLKYLYDHYFCKKITSKTKINNLIGFIDYELLVVLIKIYKKELTIDEALHKPIINDILLQGFLGYDKYKNHTKDQIYNLCKQVSDEIDNILITHECFNHDVLCLFDQTSITSVEDKSVHAEVSSPIILIDQMIEHISDDYLRDKLPTFMDYSCGKGNIISVIFMKYYHALKQTDLTDTEICKRICESYLYIADINPMNVYITICKLQHICQLITKKECKYSFNSYVGDSLTLDLMETWNIDKIDIIFVNPPFEDKINKNSTQHKLWIDFTLKTFNDWLSPEGYLYQISPSSFVSPSSKIFKLFKQKQVEILNLQQEEYFPTVNSSISWYIIKNIDDSTSETIINKDTHLLINDSLLYLPNDFNLISLSIHKKVMFTPVDKLIINYDYVTCHNNILLKSKRANTHSTLSKTETNTHIYPVFHTNKQIWWSEIKQDFADKKKVIWTRSGYTKPFYDNGKYGVTDLSYYVLVNDEDEGKYLENILTSQLFTYIFKTAKWSGFGNEKVFNSLPRLPNKKYSDQELYDYFTLTQQEITYLTNNV